jgi:hypothetical protein
MLVFVEQGDQIGRGVIMVTKFPRYNQRCGISG